MGGHGGLNILPQKRWNVYGRENRLKVARDEEKYNAEQKIKQDAHTQAEQEHRRDQLLERARRRNPESQLTGQLAAAESASPSLGHAASPAAQESAAIPDAATPPDNLIAHSNAAGNGSEPAATSKDVVVGAAAPGAGMLQHINFFTDFERREAHPDNKKEKKDEQRRRGNPETQTSDARFDAQFRLANGLYGKQNMPWYSKAGSTLPGPEDPIIQAADSAAEMLRQNGMLHVGGPHKNVTAVPALTSGAKRKHEKSKSKHKLGRKDKEELHGHSASHRSRKKRKRSSSSGSSEPEDAEISRKAARHHSSASQDKKAKLEQLRAERVEREAAERRRQQQALAAELPADSRPNRRYHSGFGNAAR